MGVIKHKDVFSAKYLTAIITDGNDRGYFVPIKKTLDDFFLTELNGTLYAFSLEGARIITYRELAVKSVKFVQYDTTHFRSLQAYHKELELVLMKNALPKISRIALTALRILGRKEKYYENGKEVSLKRFEEQVKLNEIKERCKVQSSKPVEGENNDGLIFKPFEIQMLVKDLQAQQENFPEEAENVITFLKSLGVDYVATPVSRLTDSLQEDLITTKASFLGESLPQFKRVDNEHKKISNTPITGKTAYLKIAIVGIMLVGIIAAIGIGIDEGWFDSLTGMMPSSSSFGGMTGAFTPAAQKASANQCSDDALMAKYSPLQMKQAVESGAETCKLSKNMQELVDGVELPNVEAIP